MIVIGTDMVENYLANHVGHKGIKAARTQYDAWAMVVRLRARFRVPADVLLPPLGKARRRATA